MQTATKVLIIEDDFLIREVILTMLQLEQFEVIESEDGVKGIELAHKNLPDLIICDIMMPQMSGYDVFQKLSNQEQTATIPFIFISAKSQRNDIRIGMDMGADDYITKPFTRNELISAVKTRLKKQACRQNYYEHRIDILENQIKKLEKKLEQLIYASTGEIIAPTQGWQGRFEQVVMTAEKIATLTEEIKQGLEREEFQLYYQPQVNLSTQEIVGAEALLRWQHPKRGIVSPAEFIPVAERQGSIVPIGEWAMRNVCEQAKKWQEMALSLKRITVNVSAQQLQNSEFVENVLQILMDSALNPECLELEITESSVVKNIARTNTIFQKLKKKAIQIAIDDFGTGYSALSYLTNFDFDVLKIDRSLIQDINRYPKKQAVVQLIIELGNTLDLKVIAEGVETKAELSTLKQLNCDEFQGYLFSRPVPAAEMEALLLNQKLSLC